MDFVKSKYIFGLVSLIQQALFIGIASCHSEEGAERIPPLIKLHAILMIISWCILPAISIYLARFCKNTHPQWFSIHLVCGIGTVFGTVVGLCSILAHLEGKIVGYEPHHLIGWFVLCLGAGLQPFLGWVAHKCYEPGRKMIPWIDRAHWHLGGVVWLLALWNVHLGLAMDESRWSASVPTLYYVGLAVIASTFVFGGRSIESRPKVIPSNLKELGSEELTELVDEPRLVFSESFQ